MAKDPSTRAVCTPSGEKVGLDIIILVVEDHRTIREAMAEVLSDIGYKVLSASNPNEALQLLQHNRITLLITDIRLPGYMDGFALVREAAHRQRDLKVIITGADVDQLSLEELPVIACHVLKKPFRVCELQDQVQHVVGR